MSQLRAALALLAICACSLAPGVRCQNLPGWNLVWSDEFNQANGTAPNPAKWGYDTGGGGWGNNELESYTSRLVNAYVTNGQLAIVARSENYTGSDNIPRNYTSARLKTQGKWSWTRGRIEARIQIPRGQGMWPAFWALGANIGSVGWPTCGEIDIMENIGKEPGKVHGTIHGPGYSGANGIGGPYTLPNNAVMADAFHVFAIEWETNAIRWYVDTNLYFKVTPASLPANTYWVYNTPQFLVLNVAVGGNWPGNPDGTTVFPQQMLVDYVRVYAASNAPAIGTNMLANPGFEVGGLAGWTPFGANAYLESLTNYPVYDGTNDVKVYGQFASSGAGGDNLAGFYQDKPAKPGANYTANGWLLTTASDRIAGPNTAWVEVSFRNASGATLALFRSAFFDSTTSPGTWLNFAITNELNVSTLAVTGAVTSLVAPPGTTTVRYRTVFHQPANAPGAVLFDELELVLRPAPTPVLAAANKNGTNVMIWFPSQAGTTYQVWFKSNLAVTAWQTLTTLFGDGNPISVTAPASAAAGFFQVVRE